MSGLPTSIENQQHGHTYRRTEPRHGSDLVCGGACCVVGWSFRRWSRHRQVHEERWGPWAGESTTPRELSTTGECKAPPERHRRGEGGTQALITRHDYSARALRETRLEFTWPGYLETKKSCHIQMSPAFPRERDFGCPTKLPLISKDHLIT